MQRRGGLGMRDYRALLSEVRCWDPEVQAIFERTGEPAADVALQNREELIGLCEFIEAHQVRSYLEIGVWTGATLRALQSLFHFERVAACDQGWVEGLGLGLEVRLPPEVQFFRGDSESAAFLEWRAALGPIDLVLIDANHHYKAVKGDFERNRRFPHRFLALHDITGSNRYTTGVRRLWQEIREEGAFYEEIVRPHRELGLDRSTMGIGIWSEAPAPLPG